MRSPRPRWRRGRLPPASTSIRCCALWKRRTSERHEDKRVLSSELEFCLNGAFQGAREARHEYMTVEHLLLAILDTPKVREILRACGADLAKLRRDLEGFIAETTPT